MTNDQLKDHIDDRMDSFGSTMKEMRSEVHDIKRGLYGDQKNKVPGLIDLPPRVYSLEESRKKALWILGGIIALLEAALHIAKEFIPHI